MKKLLKKEEGKKRFSRAFSKDDARHYVIYAALSKMKIDTPFLRADVILEDLKEANLF